MDNSKLDLLTPTNSVLLLVDYQVAMFNGVGSGDRIAIKKSAVAVAKAACILGVPTILTSIYPEGNGEFIKEITEIFPKIKVIVRKMPSFDALEEDALLAAVKTTIRK